MFYQNDFITQNIKKQKMNEYLQQAERDRLLLTLNPHRENPMFQFARSILHSIGHLMLTAGRWLDQRQVTPRAGKIASVALSK